MPPRGKSLKRSRRDDYEDDDLSDQKPKTSKSSKKAKTSSAADSGKDDDGNSFWSLSGTRRATVSNFKGKNFVNIREYYTDASGSLKPGKKGIMLTPEQYVKLLEAIPEINAELREKGQEIPDVSGVPASASKSAPAPADEEDEVEDEDEEAPESPVKPKKTKPQSKPKKGKKPNIEATSEEEESD